MNTFVRDLRTACRSLLSAPLFSAVAILSLALGIGSNTAIFTFLDQALLRLLPVEKPEELVLIAQRGSYPGNTRGSNTISYPLYRDLREKNQVFSGILCRYGTVVSVRLGESGERVEAELVSGNYFEVLGVRPSIGRLFTGEDETAPGANPVAVIAHDLWRDRFHSDPVVVGRKVLINNHPMTIVGVAPPGYRGVDLGHPAGVYLPVTMKRQATPSWDDLENRSVRWVQAFGRLAPGVTPEKADASINTLYQAIIQEEVSGTSFQQLSPSSKAKYLHSHTELLPGGQGFSYLRRRLEKPVWILMGLVGLVLLIACANVSSLLVARGLARRRELSIRRALGATRSRIVRHLLTESLVLAMVGTLAGLFASRSTAKAILLLAPDDQFREAFSTNLDLRILAFSLFLAVGTVLLFGLVPAFQVSGGDVVTPLKESSTSIVGGGGARLRKSLVALQVALSLLLLTGSALFIQSLENLREADTGFEVENLIRFKLDPTLSGYDATATKQFYERFQQRLESMPAIESVGLGLISVLEGSEWNATVTVEGYRASEDEDIHSNFNSVSRDYFQALGVPIVQGRDFDRDLGLGDGRAAIVNEAFTRKFFGDRSPLGYHFAFGRNATDLDLEIVGVVADSKYSDLWQEAPRQVFVCYRQNPGASEMSVYIRTTLPSSQAFELIRRESRALDPKVSPFGMTTMKDQLDRSLSLERLIAFLSGSFAFLATLLAVVGLYGVSSYNVTRRRREIGIRMALGAERQRIVAMVLREVMVLSGIGVMIGVPVAWWVARFAESQLYGIDARDPISLLLAVIGLVLAAVLAGAIPALRAARTDPAGVLRHE